MKADVLIRLVANSGQPGVCKGCRKPIVWMETLTGKKMPMNAYVLPRHADNGTEVYAAADAHWASCSARAQFDKRASKYA